jgi:hypothetical protein
MIGLRESCVQNQKSTFFSQWMGRRQTSDQPRTFHARKMDKPSFIDSQEGNSMNVFIRILRLFAILPLLIVSCTLHTVQAQPEGQFTKNIAPYTNLLGKSLTDKVVVDFIASNNCSSAAQFQLCEDAGVALLIDVNQIVETVYLYLNNAEGFGPYKGELPFGLKFYDIMGAVEYKLKRQGVGHAGLPDRGETPDHLHYRATYQQVGMTIIYNSPSAEDEDATIYAILVSQ